MILIHSRVHGKRGLFLGAVLFSLLPACVSIRDDTGELHPGTSYTLRARVDSYSVSNLSVTAFVDGTPVPMTGPTDGNVWTGVFNDPDPCRRGLNVTYQANYDTSFGASTITSPGGGHLRLFTTGPGPLAACSLLGPRTFTVTSTVDAPDDNPGDHVCHVSGGGCTLRAAVMEANATASHDRILLAAGSTYVLTPIPNDPTDAVGDLDIYDDVTIEPDNTKSGSAATITAGPIIAGPDGIRAIDIHGSSTSVTLRNLIIKRGNPAHGGGGGIRNGGNLLLDRVTLDSNHLWDPTQAGGGIETSGYLEMSRSNVFYNRGDGIHVAAGKAVIREGAFRENHVLSSLPGGIWVRSGADLELTNATIFATTGGFALQVDVNATAALRNVSIGNNNSGGIHVDGTVTLSNSLIGFNSGDIQVAPGAKVYSFGHNLIESCVAPPSGSCTLDTSTSSGGDLVNVASGITGSLTTDRLILAAGSPAFNAGSTDAPNDADPYGCPRTDQFGTLRPLGGRCDIGAEEIH